jgi:hypothetical protein
VKCSVCKDCAVGSVRTHPNRPFQGKARLHLRRRGSAVSILPHDYATRSYRDSKSDTSRFVPALFISATTGRRHHVLIRGLFVRG